jgi:RNA polymerase sigma-70 factor (ECF subfamily)
MNELILDIPRSFKEKLSEETSLLKKFARKFATDTQDVEDLVQDTILKAMLCFNGFQKGTNLKGWLYVLMRNIYINNYRKLNLYRRFAEVADDAQLSFSTARVHLNGGEEGLSIKDIRNAINQLKPLESLPFELFISGYKYHEIATSIHVPIGTVKTRIHVARTKLKYALKEYQLADEKMD